MNNHFDVVIIGGGMVGLCLAHQLIKTLNITNIAIIDKEKELGRHSSGRNSGVLHAGLYYKPDTRKAKVCVDGAVRLKQWIKQRNLPINECGKVVVPTRHDLDPQLELLQDRGRKNGAVVDIIDQSVLTELIPCARSSSGRAIWSPNTAVVKPKVVLESLEKELKDFGAVFLKDTHLTSCNPSIRRLNLSDNRSLHYGYLFNCAGLHADEVARMYGVAEGYKLMPFKGLYWQLKSTSSLKIERNLYPVPDLNVPFLGIHFTPSADSNPIVTIGPTATPALGRENYCGSTGIELDVLLNHVGILTSQYLTGSGGFRRYVHEQALLALRPLFLKSAKDLVPSLSDDDIELSSKVGIRSQVFNRKSQKLEDDFLCISIDNSTHVVNAISPAFTASFALADLIIKESKI